MESDYGTVSEHSTDGQGSRLISRVLPPAIRLWIHAQADQIQDLNFNLNGSDRQILSGYVPAVAVSARQAVYRGLHLSQVEVVASEIKINLGQVVRGKPLRLLQPFPIMGQVRLNQADLNASLQTPLLTQAIQDLLQQLLAAQGAMASLANWPSLASMIPTGLELVDGQLVLGLAPVGQTAATVTLTTGLEMRDGRFLRLDAPHLQSPTHSTSAVPLQLNDFELDLGPEVNVRRLIIGGHQIELEGVVRVIPA